jgi:RNA polymerase sigma-70 factor (ECF subfamily)
MTPADPEPLTVLLRAWSAGDAAALDALVQIVYAELRAQARRHLSKERRNHTLQPTALVHETFLRLQGQRRAQWQNRRHFFAVAAQTMRRVLVDHARARIAAKRGAGRTLVPLEDAAEPACSPAVDVLALDQALQQLAALDARQAQVVEMRYFGGLSAEETAETLGVSLPTVKRDWALARAWLFRALGGG